MKKTKIIFFGTPDFAVKSLKVINENFHVLCVVTSPDKKSGRGLKMNESEVKRFSSDNNIPIKKTGVVFKLVKLKPCNVAMIFQIDKIHVRKKDDMIRNIERDLRFIGSLSN